MRTKFETGEIYHICQRGTEGRTIFTKINDYKRFLLGLEAFNSPLPIELYRYDPDSYSKKTKKDKLANVLGYILMKNHLHLLIKCVNPENLANFLRKIFGGYTMHFNASNKRRGVLFQGRPIVKHIDSNEYLSTVFNYIHLNALDYSFPQWRNGEIKNARVAKKILLEYPWSSLAGILKLRHDPIIDLAAVEKIVETEELLDLMLNWGAEDYKTGKEF